MDPNQLGVELRAMEVELVHRDGSIVNVWLTLAPRRDGDATAGGWIAVMTDLTERKRLEAQIEEARDLALAASRAKSEFLATMSHEIRTPLNGVIGMNGLLLDTDLTAEQRDYAESAERSGEALLSLINDVLDFSKIEAGKLEVETLDFDPRQMAEDVVDLLANAARSKGLGFGCIVDPRIPARLRGDPSRLRQVLTNLVSNAVKFTTDGEVLVRLTAQERQDGAIDLRTEVSDSGIGISEDVQAGIFQPFTQADGSTTRRYGGTGLGLAISRRLVELMDGQIGVRSSVGEGSTFWFTVPLAVGAAPSLDEPDKLAAASLEGRRILVVDDQPTNRLILRHQLEGWHVVVAEAADGPTALATLREAASVGTPFDLMLLDMVLPEGDGTAIAAAMRADPSIPSMPVVLLSSVGQLGPWGDLTSLGIQAALTKPVRQGQLFQTLVGVLAAPETSAPSPANVGPTAVTSRPEGRILVVEDSAINQRVALGLLQKLGYRADAVANGVEALAALENVPYTAVLMDCQMPEMDGYEATRLLREREQARGQHLPVIAMTANAVQGDRERCLAAGMDDYVTKPVRSAEIATALARWLPAIADEAA